MSENTSTSSTPAQAVRKQARRQRLSTSRKPRKLPPYHVVLLDDDDHTYAYVIEMLVALFGYSTTRAYVTAEELDTRGRVILLTTTKEHAELKRDQVHSYGPDHRIESCAGSMAARIEPVGKAG